MNRIKQNWFKEDKKPRLIEDLFDEGAVYDASDEELKLGLKTLSYKVFMPGVLNKSSEQLNIDLIRTEVITSILNQRHIDKVEHRNQIYTWIIIVLTATSILESLF